MPELPEAETIARQLQECLAGARLDRVVHLRRDVVKNRGRRMPSWLEGAKVQRVARRGKRVVVHLAGDRGIIFFLGMTGRLEVCPPSAPLAPHTHLRIAVRGGKRELRFNDYRRFGGLRFFDMSNGRPPQGLAELGVEPLEMSAKQFRQILSRRRQIKALLLDQRVIAGLGNIYCDEALYRAGIHPVEIAADLDARRVGRLCRAVKNVLRASIQAKGTTVISYRSAEGPGAFQKRLRVYGREGEPCHTCQTPILRLTAAGRSSHICPHCQPPPHV